MSPMPALYELVGQYRSLLDMDDVPPEQLADTLDMLQGDIKEKATNIGFVVRNLEETAEAIRRAAKQAVDRANSIEGRVENLKAYALTQLMKAGISKVDHPMLCMAVKKNPPKVVIDFEDSIPAEFMKQPDPPPPKPDKTAIKAAIILGRDIPGAHLEAGNRLEIRS